MNRAIVVAADPTRAVFAVQTEEGQCAVFCQHAGRRVEPGDVLEGEVLGRGARVLHHTEGTCAAVGDSGPISLAEALDRVSG